jgi:hypothetical protein
LLFWRDVCRKLDDIRRDLSRLLRVSIRRDPSRLLRLSIPWSRQRRSRMSEAMQPDGLARPNFGAVSRNHHAKANADEDAAQQDRVSEIN